MGASASFPVVSLSRDRIVVITGGNNGIGYETAKHVAMMGATVIIACRSEEKAREAIKRMKEEHSVLKNTGKLGEGYMQDGELCLEFMKLDLASLKSTMEFIDAFKSSGRKLHSLVCNAGAAFDKLEKTVDGFEPHFQVNYLGHFLIIAHLLPIMKNSGEDCRIISTSSLGHKFAVFNLEKAQCDNPADFKQFRYYGNSKLYQLQHMFSLSKRLTGSDITVLCIHPGAVATGLTRGYANAYPVLVKIFDKVAKSPLKGALTLIDAIVNPKWKGQNNLYLVDCSSASMSSEARNNDYQEQLWKYSLDQLKEYIPDDVKQELEGDASQ